MVKETNTEDTAGQGPASYQVHFGVYVAEMHRTYTKEELENDAQACAYLVEIGSEAVSELKTN